MKTTSLISLLALSLAATQIGCVHGPSDEPEPACSPGASDDGCESDTDGDDATPEAHLHGIGRGIKLVALTPIAAASAPALGVLSARFQIVDAADERAGAPSIEALLDGASAIVADADELDAERIDSALSIVHAATRAGIPLILENVRDPDRMSRLVGVGFVAEAVLVEPVAGKARSEITLFGDSDVAPVESSSDTVRRQAEMGLAYWEMNEAERASLAEELGVSPRELAEKASEGLARLDGPARPRPDKAPVSPQDAADADGSAAAAAIVERLVERLENPPMQVKSATISDHAEGTYTSFLVKRSSVYTWCPGYTSCTPGVQQATMDVQFQVQLMASSTPAGKFLVVSNAGSGFNPGALTFNDNEDRGFFQDALEVKVVPSSSSLSHYSHQPTTPNSQNQYSTSNGCSFSGGIGAEGPQGSLSCSAGTSSTTSYTDFTVFDQSAGLTAEWDYNMSYAPADGVFSSGGAYDSWDDLVDPWWGYLRNVPNLAKSNLVPSFEVVYQASTSFTGTVPVTFSYKQTLRETWLDWYFLVSVVDTQTETTTITLPGSVDFGQVNIDHLPLVAKHSGKCLAVDGASTAQGANIVQATCNGGAEQRFEYVATPDQDGRFWIKPQNSGLCLTVNNGNLGNGVRLIQMPCAAAKDQQRFQLVTSGNGYSYLKVKHSDKCVQVRDSSLDDGALAEQSTCDGGDDQRFR